MKRHALLLLCLFLMSGMGASSQNVMDFPVKTIKGISVAMNGIDTVAVFGVTEAYENTTTSFRVLACVVPKGKTMDESLESGLCYSSEISTPSIGDGKSVVMTFNKESCVHDVVLNGLCDNKTFYYRLYIKDKDGSVAYGKTYFSSTLSIPFYTSCPDDNHPHLIDLGLPSGTKWACCNVGADKPWKQGGYYAWGEYGEKTTYTIDSYRYYNKSKKTMKYLGVDIAGTEYDVAHIRMGGSWCMPTHEQFMEIYYNCTRKWTTLKGVKGILVTGHNGGQIFMPASGFIREKKKVNYGDYGYYWSSSLYTVNNAAEKDLYNAYDFHFSSTNWAYSLFGWSRYEGFPIRAIVSAVQN